MKFKFRNVNVGDVKIVTRFAWWPVIFYTKTTTEIYWLQKVTYEKVYECSWWESYWTITKIIENNPQSKEK